MKVRDVMTRQPLTVAPSDDLALAAQMMLWIGAHHLPVLKDDELVGVLSEHDLLRHRAGRDEKEAMREPVSAAMSAPPLTIPPEEPLAVAAGLMLSRKVGCLPVSAGGKLAGLVTRTDVVRGAVEETFQTPASHLPPPVSAVMRRAPALVSPSTLLYDAVALMVDRNVRHLPVVDEMHRVVGMVSDRDVRETVGDPLQALEDESYRERLRLSRVEDVMSPDGITVFEQDPITQAAHTLVDQEIGALPVVDVDGRLVGIVSYVDVIRALL